LLVFVFESSQILPRITVVVFIIYTSQSNIKASKRQ